MADTNPFEFNESLLKALGIDADKVASYSVYGDGDIGVRVTVEFLPDLNTESFELVETVTKRFKLVPIDDD